MYLRELEVLIFSYLMRSRDLPILARLLYYNAYLRRMIYDRDIISCLNDLFGVNRDLYVVLGDCMYIASTDLYAYHAGNVLTLMDLGVIGHELPITRLGLTCAYVRVS